MPRMPFVHLRSHSEYSVVDGTLRIDDAAAAARKDGQVAMAITDLANLFGAIKFYKACRGKGVKPVLGAEVQLLGLGKDGSPAPRIVLLVQNHQGYLNLCELLSRGWTRSDVRQPGHVQLAWLRELSDEDVARLKQSAEHYVANATRYRDRLQPL